MSNKGAYGTNDRQKVRRRFQRGDVLFRGRESGDGYDRYRLMADGLTLNGDGQTAPYDQTPFNANWLKTGEEIIPRWDTVLAVTLLTQRLSLHYFTARKTEIITQVRTETGGTAAAATPTYCAIGVYTVPPDDAGTYTLVASTANDTTLWATPNVNTAFTTPLLAPWAKVRGVRYASGILCVSGAALPNLSGRAAQAEIAATLNLVPRLCARIASQSTLPATFLPSDLSNGGNTDAIQVIYLP